MLASLFRISGVNVERFCVVANGGRAFFGVRDLGCAHFLFLAEEFLWKSGQEFQHRYTADYAQG